MYIYMWYIYAKILYACSSIGVHVRGQFFDSRFVPCFRLEMKSILTVEGLNASKWLSYNPTFFLVFVCSVSFREFGRDDPAVVSGSAEVYRHVPRSWRGRLGAAGQRGLYARLLRGPRPEDILHWPAQSRYPCADLWGESACVEGAIVKCNTVHF